MKTLKMQPQANEQMNEPAEELFPASRSDTGGGREEEEEKVGGCIDSVCPEKYFFNKEFFPLDETSHK